MKDLAGRVAVVTGGGSGIGRAMALTFADAGMRIVVADIEVTEAEKVAGELTEKGAQALAVHTDVTMRDSLEALAEVAYNEFGSVELLCNNAGVGVFGPLHRASDKDWRWVLSVNLDGISNGLQAFLPRMKKQEGQKHVVNTASAAGIVGLPGFGIYNASKAAVVAITETLRYEGRRFDLSCSVLCPGPVHTNISQAERNRPEELQDTRAALTEKKSRGLAPGAFDLGRDALWVGERVRVGVENNELYIFTDLLSREAFEKRVAAIRKGFDAAEQYGDG